VTTKTFAKNFTTNYEPLHEAIGPKSSLLVEKPMPYPCNFHSKQILARTLTLRNTAAATVAESAAGLGKRKLVWRWAVEDCQERLRMSLDFSRYRQMIDVPQAEQKQDQQTKLVVKCGKNQAGTERECYKRPNLLTKSSMQPLTNSKHLLINPRQNKRRRSRRIWWGWQLSSSVSNAARGAAAVVTCPPYSFFGGTA